MPPFGNMFECLILNEWCLPDGLLGELTQEMSQTRVVSYGFPPLNSSDPTLPKCGEWPQCNRTGEAPRRHNYSSQNRVYNPPKRRNLT